MIWLNMLTDSGMSRGATEKQRRSSRAPMEGGHFHLSPLSLAG